MGLLEKLTLLYPAIPTNTLTMIIEDAQDFATNYCNLEQYDTVLDSTVFHMCKEDANRMYAEGFASESAGGNSISYGEDYSQTVYKRLNQHKRIRTL